MTDSLTARQVKLRAKNLAADDLLPFAGFPKYFLDSWARPHGPGGQGKRRGPLAAIKQWKPRKGEKPRFIFGYSLYRGGERVFKSALTCGMARLAAELAPKKAEYLAARGQKDGVR